MHKKIYEPDDGLLYSYASARTNGECPEYYVDKISHLQKYDFNHGGIYDLGTGEGLAKTKLNQCLKASDIVFIPTFYDHTTLLHTVASLKIVKEVNPDATIYVIFNGLEPTDKKGEKQYTAYALERMQKMAGDIKIRPLYIRQSFMYFKFLEGGCFFLDNYFAKTEQFMISSTPKKGEDDSCQAREKRAKKNIEHMKALKYHYEKVKRIQTREESHAYDGTYYSEVIKKNLQVIRDMYDLVKKVLDVY